MTNEKITKDKNESKPENSGIQPDKETLNTTDPPEHMEGPISSFLHKTGEGFDTDKTRQEADDKRDKNM